MIGGFATGITRMGLEWSHVPPACGSGEPNTGFLVVTKVHYLHFAIILSAVTSLIIVVVSLFTEPRTAKQVGRNRRTWVARPPAALCAVNFYSVEVLLLRPGANSERTSHVRYRCPGHILREVHIWVGERVARLGRFHRPPMLLLL